MAFIRDSKRGGKDDILRSGAVSAPSSTAPAPGTQAPSTPATPESRRTSGQAPTVQKYLQAGKGVGLGKTLATDVTQKLQKAKEDVQTAAGETYGQIKAQTAQYKPELIQAGLLAAGKTDQPSQELYKEYQDYEKSIQEGYKGPAGFTQDQQTALNKLYEDLRKKAEATKTEEGRFQLLGEKYASPTYSKGQSKLDQLLLQTDPEARKQFEALQLGVSEAPKAYESAQEKLQKAAEQQRLGYQYAQQEIERAKGKQITNEIQKPAELNEVIGKSQAQLNLEKYLRDQQAAKEAAIKAAEEQRKAAEQAELRRIQEETERAAAAKTTQEEAARQAELQKQYEAALSQQQEEARKKAEEQAKLLADQEQARLYQEAQTRAQAEAAAKAAQEKAAAEAQRKALEEQVASEKAAADQKAAQEAELAKQAEIARMQEVARQEAAKQAEEAAQRKAAEEAAAKAQAEAAAKAAQEKAAAEEKAELERAAQEKAAAEEAARQAKSEQERLAAEQAAKDAAAREAQLKQEAEAKAAEQARLAQEKAAADAKAAEDKRIADEQYAQSVKQYDDKIKSDLSQIKTEDELNKYLATLDTRGVARPGEIRTEDLKALTDVQKKTLTDQWKQIQSDSKKQEQQVAIDQAKLQLEESAKAVQQQKDELKSLQDKLAKVNDQINMVNQAAKSIVDTNSWITLPANFNFESIYTPQELQQIKGLYSKNPDGSTRIHQGILNSANVGLLWAKLQPLQKQLPSQIASMQQNIVNAENQSKELNTKLDQLYKESLSTEDYKKYETQKQVDKYNQYIAENFPKVNEQEKLTELSDLQKSLDAGFNSLKDHFKNTYGISGDAAQVAEQLKALAQQNPEMKKKMDSDHFVQEFALQRDVANMAASQIKALQSGQFKQPQTLQDLYDYNVNKIKQQSVMQQMQDYKDLAQIKSDLAAGKVSSALTKMYPDLIPSYVLQNSTFGIDPSKYIKVNEKAYTDLASYATPEQISQLSEVSKILGLDFNISTKNVGQYLDNKVAPFTFDEKAYKVAVEDVKTKLTDNLNTAQKKYTDAANAIESSLSTEKNIANGAAQKMSTYSSSMSGLVNTMYNEAVSKGYKGSKDFNQISQWVKSKWPSSTYTAGKQLYARINDYNTLAGQYSTAQQQYNSVTNSINSKRDSYLSSYKTALTNAQNQYNAVANKKVTAY